MPAETYAAEALVVLALAAAVIVNLEAIVKVIG